MWNIAWNQGIVKRFYRKEPSPFRVISFRLMVIFLLILLVALIFWVFERDGIEDTHDGDFSFIDSIYFTVVTVTTLGYGDIVPISESARMFDAVIITPVRIIVWVLFIGTAYQFVIRNHLERFKMQRALKNLKDHVIIAGYGTTGAAAVDELVINGYNEDNLIVLENSEEQVKEAAEAGATGILGDPTREDSLIKAGIKGARVLIIATHQDDTNVMITLTAKDLNKNVKTIARVSHLENIKQLKRAGADIIVSPSLMSGNLMAMAVSNSKSVKLIENLLTTSRGVNVIQRPVNPSEVGKRAKALSKCVVVGVVRKNKNIGPRELDKIVLEAGDDLILLG
jgi:voltage-gated potassium channel